jgi:hypothetical protein
VSPESASLAQQKMCAEQAKKMFEEDEESARQLGDKNEFRLADHTSHFDPQKNVCYVRIQTTTTSKTGPAESIAVSDAFERRLFALYVWTNTQGKKYWEVKPYRCEVHPPKQETIKCQSSEEFNALVEKWFGVVAE